MSVPVRVVTLLVAFAAVVVGAVFIVAHYVVGSPPTVDYTSAASGGQVNVVLQEDPQNNSSSKPDWVSYYVMKPGANPMQASSWVHTTLLKVPANTQVNMTIYGYDGCTPPRNNFWTQVQGTMGGTVTVQQFKNPGKPLGPVVTTPTINGWAHCAVGHTFAIPSMHVFVPVGSPNASASLCGSSPCVSGPYTLEKFSFRTTNAGEFRWQCFVPCGGGFLDGNGGPMATLGYMTGQITVVG
ncbi:MAG TPA: hypothetical protein VMV17_14195 [Streptosporangiaceae bacterium]|nr:hypothetical protein [Streptosporangiaceae bacterium]